MAVHPTAHSLACLRIGVFVTADAARLAPGVGGSPFTGRVSHPLDGEQSFMTSPHRHSPLTSLAWSHCAPTPGEEDGRGRRLCSCLATGRQRCICEGGVMSRRSTAALYRRQPKNIRSGKPMPLDLFEVQEDKKRQRVDSRYRAESLPSRSTPPAVGSPPSAPHSRVRCMGCGDVRLLRTIRGVDFTGQERATLNKLTMPSAFEAPSATGSLLYHEQWRRRRVKYQQLVEPSTA